VSEAYAASGVDYETLDAAKRFALTAARATAELGAARGARLDAGFFGEPAALVEVGSLRLGFVLECLGTKSLIAAALEEATGADHYSAIGFDTVAAAVNDCCCVGALPVVVNAYFATGAADFYGGSRHRSLVEGFARGCAAAGASWGGGESPTLSGIVSPQAIDLAAAAIGIVPPGAEPLAAPRLEVGDEIVLVASSGLHQNGASLVRSVAERLDGGLLAPLPSGRLFGEAVLDESVIYAPLVEALLRSEGRLHYASNITGHGLRKLMRADRELRYRVDELPEVPEVLTFLAGAAGLDDREAYGTLNMGAGYALFVAAGEGAATCAQATALGLRALVAGEVEEGRRSVLLAPLGVTYAADELELR